MIMVERILSDEALERTRKAYATLDFVDGKVTAGRNVVNRKHNQQADSKAEATDRLVKFLHKQVSSHPIVQAGCWPRRISNVTFNKFGPGDYYKSHLDNVLQSGRTTRTDISVTMWLSDPDEYEGGHLTIYDGDNATRWKQKAGEAIFYPSGLLHEVTEVTKGERKAACFWIESRIRDDKSRALLLDLHRLIETLDREQHRELVRATRVYYGLLQRWLD